MHNAPTRYSASQDWTPGKKRTKPLYVAIFSSSACLPMGGMYRAAKAAPGASSGSPTCTLLPTPIGLGGSSKRSYTMHNDLLFILHAAQAVAAEDTNERTKEFFINEIIAKAVALLEVGHG